MILLTEIALGKAVTGIFTRPEVACWIGGSPDRQFSLLKRALAAGEVVRIHRGIYCLADKYLGHKADPLVLAQRIYGPSYISLETALSYHGWIPEAVYAITSTSLDRSREFDTPLGRFSFTRIPQKTFYVEVSRVEKESHGGTSASLSAQSLSGGGFLLASPLKALADYIYVHKQDWTSARPVIESLRVDEGVLASVAPEAFDRLIANYSSLRVRRFLDGLRKDLHR